MGAFKSGCERAREWVSLELDGELSELERAMLREHLGRCPGCAAFADGLRALSHALRATPLERPEPLPVPHSGVRLRVRALQAFAAAAAVAAAVGLGSLAGSLSSSKQHRASEAAAAGPTTGVAAARPPYLERKLLALDPPQLTKPHGGERIPF